MDGRPTWTDCDEAGDYVVPNVLSPRDLVSRPDNMDETVQHRSQTAPRETKSDFFGVSEYSNFTVHVDVLYCYELNFILL